MAILHSMKKMWPTQGISQINNWAIRDIRNTVLKSFACIFTNLMRQVSFIEVESQLRLKLKIDIDFIHDAQLSLKFNLNTKLGDPKALTSWLATKIIPIQFWYSIVNQNI